MRPLFALFALITVAAAAFLTGHSSAYREGYQDATNKAQIEFFQGPEGYCLADVPQHPGDCHGPQ